MDWWSFMGVPQDYGHAWRGSWISHKLENPTSYNQGYTPFGSAERWSMIQFCFILGLKTILSLVVKLLQDCLVAYIMLNKVKLFFSFFHVSEGEVWKTDNVICQPSLRIHKLNEHFYLTFLIQGVLQNCHTLSLVHWKTWWALFEISHDSAPKWSV